MIRRFACAIAGMLLFYLADAQEIEIVSGPQVPFPAFQFFIPEMVLDEEDTIAYSTPLSFCDGGSVVLTADGAPSGAGFQWKKNNVNIGGATSVSYTATESGSYSVVVTSASGTVTYDAVVVTVYAYPEASFTFSPSSQCSNIPVQFTNTSTGTGVSYSWNFGDPNSGNSNTSSSVHPVHTFVGVTGNNNQNFTVRLIATSNGCKDTVTAQVTTKKLPGTELGGTGFTVYNNLPYFTACASGASDFDFTNQSSTSSTNTGYTIKWGDNSADFNSTGWGLTSHSYGIGAHSLQNIVSGGNGCKDTAVYYVYVGNNPAVGLNNPGNTFICSGDSLTFPISGTSNNTPGTFYTVSFNDGTASQNFSHPAPADITHVFDIGSCGTMSGSFPNSFQAMIQASNPCGTSAATVVPIYVSQKGEALFDISPYDTVCVNNTVTLTNTSTNSFGVSSSGVCSDGKGVWQISPATGWSVSSGTLGNDFGSANPSLWSDGSTSLNINFSIPGVYTIKLKTGATQLCGVDEIVQTICVNPSPIADFNIDKTSGCGPLHVKATNISNTPLCGNNSYLWSVDYSNTSGCLPNTSLFTFTNNTSASSPNPEFLFTNPGIYTITLITRSPGGTCSSTPISKTVTVKAKPSAVINSPTAVCQNQSIHPTATTNNCYSTTAATYAWSFPGGSPSSSNLADPGNINYNTSGNFTISLTVTNECGSTTVTRNITVNPAPDVQVPDNMVLCSGSETGLIDFTSSVGGAVFNWTNSNTSIGLAAGGSGDIPSFIVTNNGSTPQTATITVVPVSGCSGPGQSFTITVNPSSTPPQVVSPVVYCVNENATALAAVAGTGNTLSWYNNAALNNGTAAAPLPSTATAGSQVWYVTQTNSFNCRSAAASITVQVLPDISGNTIAQDQTICSGQSPSAITSQGTIGGGNNSYTYQWQVSDDGGSSWTNISGATSANYSPGSLSGSRKFRRLVNSSNCSDTSNVVTILVQGVLEQTNISASQTICAGTAPMEITGEIPTGGSGSFNYVWESSTDNVNWNVIAGAVSPNYQPPVLNQSSYYRRKTVSGNCSAYSSVVIITVNPKPFISMVTDKIFCQNEQASGLQMVSTPSTGTAFAWTNTNTATGLAASGNGNLPAFTATNNSDPRQPVSSDISVVPTYSANGTGCTGDTMNFTITVLPSVTILPLADTVVCTGSVIPSITPVHDAGVFSGATIDYSWNVSGQGISLTSGSGIVLPSFSSSNTGATDLTATITVTPRYTYNGHTCNGIPESFSVITKPGVPQAQAGADVVLCAADSYQLQAAVPQGASGAWHQINGTALNISNTSDAQALISGMLPGNVYEFVWTVSGFSSCAPTKDTVRIEVVDALSNTIDLTTITICASQTATITGHTPTGGSGVYSYQWQQSADGINWTNITGATGISLSFTPAQTVYIRRVVNAEPCSSFSDPAEVIVQPAISNNTISASQVICTATIPAPLSGALPTGGNGIYNFQWQISTDGGVVWTDIPGANGQDYAPGVVQDDVMFRRLVSTSLCTGPQADISNIISISVNPDAQASFNPTNTTGCIPFELNDGVIGLQPFPLQNGQYVWYVNDVLIGSGTGFPGYTMTQADDSIRVKLVTVSAFGCKDDSTFHDFFTHKVPQPAFTVMDTVGCGPLTVQITNTTPELDEFSYQWSFGNGQTSTLAQPGSVTYLPNPASGDTTYFISLSVVSSCQTYVVKDSVRVKARPKGLFAPDKTFGCSPMTVHFNNISAGIGNSYTWDFGDGSTPLNMATAAQVSHTFHSGIQDTFYVKLVAVNECGSDTMSYAIVVSPNQISLDFAVNGNEFSGCSPHAVQFINNSSGATHFTWNFGDNNVVNTTDNIDTVNHTYLLPGSYTVTLTATNGCSDTSSTEQIMVFAKPEAAFIPDAFLACIGDTIQFSNLSSGAGSYLWNFGDGSTSSLAEPLHHFTTAGTYTVKLVTYSFNSPGTVCVDSAEHTITISDQMPGSFTASATNGSCVPFTVQFTNHHVPSVSAVWDFGDGNTGSGNQVSHTYTQPGIYLVTLLTVVPGGCTYTANTNITVAGPSGSWTHTTGYLCESNQAVFQVNASNADEYIYHFGDGTSLTSASNVVQHQYQNPGVYFPKVILKNNSGCEVELEGIDSIRVDRINAAFTNVQLNACGFTNVQFSSSSFAYFGLDQYSWDFGDGNTAAGSSLSHQYQASGVYPVQLIVHGNSGCSDTIQVPVEVHVNNLPVTDIVAAAESCQYYSVNFNSNIQTADAVNFIQWNIGSDVVSNAAGFSHVFSQPGQFTIRLVAGTVAGCYDTVYHQIEIRPSPAVTASNDLLICRGSSAPLMATGTGVVQYSWSPLNGLNCYDCANPVASPDQTTPYLVQGTNIFGCSAYDTVVVTVIQPLHLDVSAADSICTGSSTNLLASGASSYSWSPAAGLNNTTISNPTASPSVTTTYRVVGYDDYNCFTDTAFVTVAVGEYPAVNLGPDLTLATGTMHPLHSVIQNGPITQWLWTPSTDLSCDDCALPVAHIKKDIEYQVMVTTAYGCSASDSIRIKTFCEKAQVFIPNAFTPNGDGHNDVLMVRASGISMVKTFRIFNRWGELVFEKSNCAPNDPQYGWDGRIKGLAGGPDVYVYTAEVVCENGSTYTYKGNVTLLK